MALKTKKSVSISGIFKGRGGLRKDNPKLLDHSSRVSKSTIKKHGKALEHSLVREFSETIELSRTEIVRTATASITSTHHILLGNLAVTSTDSANFIEEALAEKDELTKPLAQELLQYGAHDGKSAGTASLGNRMKMFKKKVAKEERELAALWEEWTEVQRLITEVGVEILGSQAVEALATRATGTLGGFEITESTKIAQEIEANKQRLRQEIESMTAGLIERMHASEKEMDIRTQKQRQEFLTALGADY